MPSRVPRRLSKPGSLKYGSLTKIRLCFDGLSKKFYKNKNKSRKQNFTSVLIPALEVLNSLYFPILVHAKYQGEIDTPTRREVRKMKKIQNMNYKLQNTK